MCVSVLECEQCVWVSMCDCVMVGVCVCLSVCVPGVGIFMSVRVPCVYVATEVAAVEHRLTDQP